VVRTNKAISRVPRGLLGSTISLSTHLHARAGSEHAAVTRNTALSLGTVQQPFCFSVFVTCVFPPSTPSLSPPRKRCWPPLLATPRPHFCRKHPGPCIGRARRVAEPAVLLQRALARRRVWCVCCRCALQSERFEQPQKKSSRLSQRDPTLGSSTLLPSCDHPCPSSLLR
jgi:hypothetical protein